LMPSSRAVLGGRPLGLDHHPHAFIAVIRETCNISTQ
jgi:hypothetical protein